VSLICDWPVLGVTLVLTICEVFESHHGSFFCSEPAHHIIVKIQDQSINTTTIHNGQKVYNNMASTASTKKEPPRLNTKDYMIRSKALDLLQRSTPDHQIVYENDSDENSDFSWITPSYQHSPTVPTIERRRQQQQQQPAIIASKDQWIDTFLPAVNCISNACQVGISSMVKQTTGGIHIIKNDLKQRRLDRENLKEEYPSYPPPPPQNFKQRDSKRGSYGGIRGENYPSYPPPHNVKQRDSNRGYGAIREEMRAAAGQQTAERYFPSEYIEEADILCYHPGEWRPSGLLFVPAEDLRQHQYDDMSALTDDGSARTTRITRTTTKCFGFCPIV